MQGRAGSAGSLGARLRDARERAGLSLPAIARSLRIPLKSLQALEEGAVDVLPSGVYARGFVRAYAEVLGLDPDQAVRDFTTSLPRAGGLGGVGARLVPGGLHRRRRFLTLRPQTTVVLGGALVGAAVLAYLLIEVRTYTRAPFLEVTEPVRNVEITGSTIVVRGTTDPTAEVRINGERTFVKDDGTFEETLGVSEGVNALRVTAASVGGREQTVTREVLAHVGAVPVPPSPAADHGPAAPRPGDPVRLGVAAEGEPVWVLLRVEGRVVFAGLLLPGSRQEVEGREIHVTSGKGRQTLLSIDGVPRGRLADDPGVVRDLRFTRGRTSGTVERR